MNQTGKVIIFGALFIVVGFFAWEGYFSAEARMERFLDSVATPAESLNLDAVMASFSDGYADSFQQDKELLSSRLAEGFSKFDSLNVTISSIQATYEGEGATGQFDLVVVARRGEERLMVVGTPLQPQHLGITLVRDEGDWLIHRIERRIPQQMAAPEQN